MKIVSLKNQNTTAPIELWHKLINSDLRDEDLAIGLSNIYKLHGPSVTELVMESYCPNKCQHCIYPPDYHHYSKSLSEDEWANSLNYLYKTAGLRRFVYSGRHTLKKHFQILNGFKKKFPDIRLGIIADANELEPLIEDLIRLRPDWVDISLDGLEKEHDFQRMNEGSFRKTIENLHLLRALRVSEKINILTCLTNLNKQSVLDMIKLLNKDGFTNFFISPLTIVKGYRPDPNLMLSAEDFTSFINTSIKEGNNLIDAYVAIDIYEANYAQAIQLLQPDIFNNFLFSGEHLEYTFKTGDNEIYVNFYPSSLTGLRECIVNSDGCIIPPKVMAMGEIPDNLIFGNILNVESNKNIFQDIAVQNKLKIKYCL